MSHAHHLAGNTVKLNADVGIVKNNHYAIKEDNAAKLKENTENCVSVCLDEDLQVDHHDDDLDQEGTFKNQASLYNIVADDSLIL